MAGYNGYSMSNNAVAAYESGEKPFSKWTKRAIFDEVQNLVEDEQINISFDMMQFAKLNKANMTQFLYKSSWHHTSNHYNKTDFYSIDGGKLEELTSAGLQELLKLQSFYTSQRKKRLQRERASASTEQQPVFRKCRFLVWSGTRKHPKATEYTEVCEIKGNFALTTHGRKNINAKGFCFMD